MSLITPILRSKDASEPLQSGEYIGILVRIVEKGTREELYKITNKAYKRAKVLFTWVLPYHQTIIQQQTLPVLVHKEYTLSLWDKSPMYKDVVSMIGMDFTPAQHNQPFDLLSLGGCAARLKLSVHRQDKKEYIDVIDVLPLSEEDDIPESPYSFSSLTFDMWDWAIYDTLSERTKNDILQTPEYARLPAREVHSGENDKNATSAAAPNQNINPPSWQQNSKDTQLKESRAKNETKLGNSDQAAVEFDSAPQATY